MRKSAVILATIAAAAAFPSAASAWETTPPEHPKCKEHQPYPVPVPTPVPTPAPAPAPAPVVVQAPAPPPQVVYVEVPKTVYVTVPAKPKPKAHKKRRPVVRKTPPGVKKGRKTGQVQAPGNLTG